MYIKNSLVNVSFYLIYDHDDGIYVRLTPASNLMLIENFSDWLIVEWLPIPTSVLLLFSGFGHYLRAIHILCKGYGDWNTSSLIKNKSTLYTAGRHIHQTGSWVESRKLCIVERNRQKFGSSRWLNNHINPAYGQ